MLYQKGVNYMLSRKINEGFAVVCLDIKVALL